MSYFLIAAAIVFSGALILAIAAGKPLPDEARASSDSGLEELLPQHTHHFPKLRQSLASADARYVRQNISIDEAETLGNKRRQILRNYLAGIGADFARLNRLAQLAEAVPWESGSGRRPRRVWLALIFRLNYRVASVRIAAGQFKITGQLAGLTEAVGTLSALIEARMAQFPEESLGMERPGDLSL